MAIQYVDVHSHWTDSRLGETAIAEQLSSALNKKINFFLQGGVNPQEWQKQIEINNKYPGYFGACFGLHPYFVAETHTKFEGDVDDTLNELEKNLDELALQLPQAMALGEAGLDFRPHIMKESENIQIEMFENQIELAKAFEKPMVLHIVQAHEKAAQVLELWQAPSRGGFLHAYNGSYETAKKFIDHGFLISVGGAATYEKNKKLHDCLKKIPMEYLLIESDSPDQAPQGWEGLNTPESIYRVAEAVGRIKNISLFDVLEVSTGNFKRLFRL